MSDTVAASFALDGRLVADTAFVCDWALCRVLLMDDARFPWLILVPRAPGAVELDDLAPHDRTTLLHEIERAMQVLRNIAPCDKLNIGALGNIVRQLHVHVVARTVGDAAWPGPVWGSGAAVRYEPTAREALVARLRAVTAA
ncbi:MAG TPA: HIT domain-containing protein [Rhodanobacteraceae bacterium]|jgi:diadenosine tetraphosphate (Ap4A) HIT family hydrolase|nr:HIT domain-containing protein [Rhodanobacteraceae bacterium]